MSETKIWRMHSNLESLGIETFFNPLRKVNKGPKNVDKGFHQNVWSGQLETFLFTKRVCRIMKPKNLVMC